MQHTAHIADRAFVETTGSCIPTIAMPSSHLCAPGPGGKFISDTQAYYPAVMSSTKAYDGAYWRGSDTRASCPLWRKAAIILAAFSHSLFADSVLSERDFPAFNEIVSSGFLVPDHAYDSSHGAAQTGQTTRSDYRREREMHVRRGIGSTGCSNTVLLS